MSANILKIMYAENQTKWPGWVGLGGTTGTGQINDHARSKNSSLALCPPFTQNRCHFGRGFSNKIFPPLQEQSCRSDPYSMHILGAPGDEMLLTKTNVDIEETG